MADNDSTASARAPYPPARVPLLPTLSRHAFLGNRTCNVGTIFSQTAGAVPTASGREAIALALGQARLQPGEKVLVPAFHCLSMIEAVRAAAAHPVYFRIRDDLSVDLDHIRACIDTSTRALLVVHYFGFPQHMPSIRAFCDEHGLILIEDCAHAFFGSSGGHALGWHADYAVASAKKFFAVYDGGYLVSVRHEIDARALQSAGVLFNLKALVNSIEYAVTYGRLSGIDVALALPLRLQRSLWRRLKRSRRIQSQPVGPNPSGEYRYLDRAWFGKRMSLLSRATVRIAPKGSIIERRRENYRVLAQGLSDLANARPLFPELPPDVVPYMFPLLIDRPTQVFPSLKAAGVPIYRWEEIETDICATSRAYSQQLLQLPCHQDLSAAELRWLIESIHKALLAPPR